MQVVKIVLSAIILLVGGGCNSQDKIVGEFQRSDKINVTEDIGIIYFFDEDNTFKQTKYRHLGEKELAKGRYSIIADTLILKYEAYNDLNSSKYVINRSQPIKDPLGSIIDSAETSALFAKIKVVNHDNLPLAGVNLLMRNINEELILGFISDHEGNYPDISIHNAYIDNLLFSFLGYQEVSIETNEIFGHASEITVILASSSVSYSSFNGIEKYLIIEMSADKIVMTSIIENETIILNKKK